MTEYSSTRISSFMTDLQAVSSEMHDIINHIRDIHFHINPDITEEIKYGGLVFLKNQELTSGVFCYKAHTSIEFGKGSEMDDPHSVLEGSGKYRRHIKISSADDISAKHVADYIRQAYAD